MGNPDTKRNGEPPLDLLWGAAAIAAELNRSERDVYHMVRAGLLGDTVKKVGHLLCADRVALIQHFRSSAG